MGEFTLHEVQDEDTWWNRGGGHLDPPPKEEREEQHADQTFAGQRRPRTLWFGFAECWSCVDEWGSDSAPMTESSVPKSCFLFLLDYLAPPSPPGRHHSIASTEPHLSLSQHRWGPAWYNPSSLACCPNPAWNVENKVRLKTLKKNGDTEICLLLTFRSACSRDFSQTCWS